MSYADVNKTAADYINNLFLSGLDSELILAIIISSLTALVNHPATTDDIKGYIATRIAVR